MPLILRLSIATFAATLTGCGSTFIGTRVEDTTDTPTKQIALQYHLPEDVVEVVVTLERTTSTKVVGSLNNPQLAVEDIAVPVGASINLQTIANMTSTYLLDADASGLSKNNTAFTVNETGLLQSVNAKTTGTGGIVFDNVMKLAGEIIPLVNLAQGKFLVPRVKTTTADTAKDIETTGARFRSQLAVETLNKKAMPANCKDESYLFQNYFPNTLKYRYAFKHLIRKDELIAGFCDTLEFVANRRASYRAALAEYERVKTATAIKAIGAKVDRLRAAYDDSVAAHVAARAAITSAVEDTLQQQGVGSKSERYTQRSVLHLSALPPRASVADVKVVAVKEKDARSLDDQMRAAVAAVRTPQSPDKGAFSPEALSLFATTGILLTAEPLSNGTVATQVAPTLCKEKTLSCVYYLTPRPYLLTAWTVQTVKSANDSEPEEQRLVQSDSKVVDAIGDQSPVQAIALRESSLTKRDTTLAFSPRGRLTALTRDYSSAAEDASSSIASGLSNGLAQYQTTLTNLKTIRSTENELELQPLQQTLALANAQSAIDLQPIQAQVTAAQQQLVLINGQTALQAAAQGQAEALQTQLTNIQNSLVAAQSQLVNSQSALASAQANVSQSEAQATLAASTSMLTAQIQELRNEVELLKLKQQLEAMKTSSEE